VSSEHEARLMLTEVQQLRARAAKQAHGGVWLPVVAFAVLLLLSIGLYRAPFHHLNSMRITVPYWAGLPAEQRAPIASYAFWFLGSATVFALMAIWYRRRGRRTGMRVAWQRAVGAGLGTLLFLAVIAAVPVEIPEDASRILTDQPPGIGTVLLHGLLTPLLPVALAVVVLGVVEHSRALTAAGAWVGLLAWVQCTFGMLAVLGVLTGVRYAAPKYTQLPGPLLLAMALPLLVFGVAAAVRSARAACPDPHG
jgi:hypothetical protein